MDDHASYEDTIRQYNSWELDDILHNIDRGKFPERYQMVLDEIARRAEERKGDIAVPDEPSPDVVPLEKPNTLRGLIADLIQPETGRKSVSVRYTNETFLWVLLGLLFFISVKDVSLMVSGDGSSSRATVIFFLILQAIVIGTALLKRPSAIFFMKFWGGLMVVFGVILTITGFMRGWAEVVSGMAGAWIRDPAESAIVIPMAIIFVIVFYLGLGIVYYIFAENYVVPVFEEDKEADT